MAAVSLTTLRARAREKADFAGSAFILDSANGLDAWINEGAEKLHGLLATLYGDEYFESTHTFNTVAGTETYALPADFLKLLGIDWTENGKKVDLQKFTFKERNHYRGSYTSILAQPRYRLAGGYVRFLPVPSVATSVTLYYIPTFTKLVNGGDTVNFPNGWESYVVTYAAICCRKKEESEAGPFESELAKLEQEITARASVRDPGEPNSAVDVERADLEFEELLW